MAILLNEILQNIENAKYHESGDLSGMDTAIQQLKDMIAAQDATYKSGIRTVYTKPMEVKDIIEFFEQYGIGLHNAFDAMERIYLHNLVATPLDQIDVIKHSEVYVAMFQNRKIFIKLSIS